jgi:coenzyme F420-reducing hydrogenase delta subunit
MGTEKINALCEYLNNNVAKRYPVTNRILNDSTDFIKNGYLRMLAVILQQVGDVSKPQLEMFKRIVEGVSADHTAEDYLRMALDIEIADYTNFTDECKNLDVRYRWLLDALIVTCVGEHQDSQLTLIAQFCESLEISKDEIKYVAEMAKAIIGMDKSGYVTALENNVDTVSSMTFSDYMYLILDDCVFGNGHMTMFQPRGSQDINVDNLNKIKEVETPVVKIVGADINLGELSLQFKNKESVILVGCNFTGGSKYPIEFNQCNRIVIKDCSFTGFKTRTLVVEEVDTIVIEGCTFKDCQYKYTEWEHWYKLGGVIYSNSASKVKLLNITNSSFVSCGGINANKYLSTVFISNINSTVNNCKFTDCWHYSEGNIKNESNTFHFQPITMFPSDSQATNCTFEDSAAFC